MERAKAKNFREGRLFVVATPIGNLKDITFRALEVLKGVDLIVAESPSHTRALCNHYQIKTRVTRFNQHTKEGRIADLLEILRSGKDIALVSSAGTPGISDPGSDLVRRCVEEGIEVSPVPGPCAVAAAFSVSGMPSDGFVFLGFELDF